MEKWQLTLSVTAGFPSSWKDCCSLGLPGSYSGMEILSLNWSLATVWKNKRSVIFQNQVDEDSCLLIYSPSLLKGNSQDTSLC